MNGFLKLSIKNLLRHRTRSALTMLGIAASVGVLFSVLSFNRGFNEGLAEELDRTGLHFMIVPSGCAHEVAALVLHGAVIPKLYHACMDHGMASVARDSGFRAWVLGDVEVEHSPAIMGKHDEDEEHMERRRGDGEEVDRHKVLGVIVQERAPGLGRRPAVTPETSPVTAL